MFGKYQAFKALIVSLFIGSLCVGWRSSAAAQPVFVSASSSDKVATTVEDDGFPHISPTRIYGGLWLGFAGHTKLEDNNYRAYGASTVGGQFGLDVVGFHDLLSLGAEVRFGAAKSNAGKRSQLLDVVLKPRLRLVPENSPLEFYFTTPIGFTVPRLSDSNAGSDGNVGWNFGVGGGANLFLGEGFGINVEPMWLTHRFKVNGTGGDTLSIQEFALFLNAVLAIQ
jgi:hypothetical protein